MLRMRRHSILSAPRVFQMENRFPEAFLQNFLDSKKFLTKTLFLSQASYATHTRNGLSFTLFHP